MNWKLLYIITGYLLGLTLILWLPAIIGVINQLQAKTAIRCGVIQQLTIGAIWSLHCLSKYLKK